MDEGGLLFQEGRPEDRRRGRTRHAFRITLFVAAIVLFLAALWSREIPLHDSWRDLLVAEFRGRGIEIEVGGLAISPFEGVVARRAVLYEGAERKRVVASAERLGVGVDWYKLATRRHFLDMIDLKGGRIVVGSLQEGRMEFDLSDLYARLYLGERQIRVAAFRAMLDGIQITASGTLLNHGKFRMPEREGPGEGGEGLETSSSDDLLNPAAIRMNPAALLDTLKVGEGSRINLEFSGDLAEPKTVEVKGRALIENLSLGGYKAGRLRAEFKWTGSGRLDLRRFELADKLGRLACTGFYHAATGSIGVQFESGIDLFRLLKGVADAGGLERPRDAEEGGRKGAALFPEELELYGPQRLNGTVVRRDGRLEVTGDFSFEEIRFRHLKLSVGGQFSTDGARVMFRETFIEDGRGRMEGDLLFSKGRTRASIKSSLNPTIMKPFFSGRPRAALDEWVFHEAPEIEFEATMNGLDPATLTGSGRLRLGRTTFRGVTIREATSNIAYAKGAFTYTGLWVERPEGFLSGKMIYDFAGSEVRFEDVISTVDPQECCVWVDPRIRQDLRMFRFRGPPTLSINGHAQFGGKTDVNLLMKVDAPKGFEYDVIGKWLPVDSARAALQFSFGRLDIRQLDAATLGGVLRGNIFVSLRPDDRTYGADLDLDGIDFEKFTKLYFNYEGSQGEMRARYNFRSLMDSLATMNGEGSVVVTRGNVFAIPVFGPLSTILNAIIPGVGYSPAKRAFASFKVRNGVAETRDMEVQGTGFTMLGEGFLDFVRDRMDFNVRINARGVPGVILFPVSKLFEYTSTSPLSNPQWRPKRFSLPLLSGREGRGGDDREAEPKPDPTPQRHR